MVYTYRNRETLHGDDYDEFKDKLKSFFEALKKKRLYARQNFSCCGSCAGCELGEKLRVSQTRKTPKHGFVTYNRQDNQNIPYGYVYMSYATLGNKEEDTRLGQLVIKTAAEMGLATEWNGSASTRIKVIAPCKASPLKNLI